MYAVRQAAPPDVETVMAFIRKKAELDREVGAFSGEVRSTAELVGKGLFGSPAFAHALLLEAEGAAVGFAFYYFRFSSFAGRPSLWLDDLYIDPGERRGGAGAQVMRRLAEIASAADCTHLAWTADERNEVGMGFYRKLGAEVVDQRGHSVTWRIAPAALLALEAAA